jgi:hypothetical protein
MSERLKTATAIFLLSVVCGILIGYAFGCWSRDLTGGL